MNGLQQEPRKKELRNLKNYLTEKNITLYKLNAKSLWLGIFFLLINKIFYLKTLRPFVC